MHTCCSGIVLIKYTESLGNKALVSGLKCLHHKVIVLQVLNFLMAHYSISLCLREKEV